MFEVNGVYANRKGEYTVLELNPPKMRVRYQDGSEAELKIELQERIWANIAAEYEARAAKEKARRPKVIDGNYYIKVVSIPDETENSFPGWLDKKIMGPIDNNPELRSGDRLILYALEYKAFFAVATITGESKAANPKVYLFNIADEQREFYPVDIDVSALKFENGAPVDSVDMESHPGFKRTKPKSESFLAISEDDFELLAEAITEAAEEEIVDDEDDLLEDEEDSDD